MSHGAMESVSELFQIRYIKLHFTLRFPEDSVLPVNKPSALRGGIGEMLLRANCIRDRKCEQCDFEPECIVRRVMYSKMEIQPGFMSAGDSVGYVVECEDYRDHLQAGEELGFQLILFGKNIVYFNQYMQALYALGQQGLGKEHARFVIAGVTNSLKQNILKGNNIYMKSYSVNLLADYAEYRMNQLRGREEVKIRLQSPLTIKKNGEFLKEPDIRAVLEALWRRLYMLNCFEGIEMKEHFPDIFPVPEMRSAVYRPVRIKRYSNRTNSGMPMEGVEGTLTISRVTEDVMRLLAAGELIHIGKNTSFGFGRYRILI